MLILDDGSVYLEKGECVPLKCPNCGTLIPFVATVNSVTCACCGLTGIPEDFSDVQFELRRN